MESNPGLLWVQSTPLIDAHADLVQVKRITRDFHDIGMEDLRTLDAAHEDGRKVERIRSL